MNWITFGIAVVSFFMSLASWIKDFITQRKHIECKILEIKSYQDITFFRMIIENRSRLPIAIARMILVVNDKKFDCTLKPTIISEQVRRVRKEVIDRKTEFSQAFPIQLLELGAINGIILFEKMQELPENSATHLTFLISTNRGNPMKMILELPEGWASQRNTF